MMAGLRARWRQLGRSGQEWVFVILAALIIASVLGGLTTHGAVGWRQMTGFGLVMAFYAIFALGLSLEFGYTGLLNLGHVGFMAIGAYTYGILMMGTSGRPSNSAPVVGWLFDKTDVFQGNTGWGLAVCVFGALLAAALLLVPLMLSMETAAHREKAELGAHWKLLQALLIGGAGALLAWIGFRIDAADRSAFLAGLILSLVFAGFLAAVGGTVLAVRALVALAVGYTPLQSSRRARTVISVTIAVGMGIWAFTALYPLGKDGAVAMAVLLTVVLGMIIAAGVAALMGLPAIRLREDYLAIVTLGFAEILRSVILNEEAWTRGAQPIQTFPRPVSTWATDTVWWKDFAREAGVRPGDLALLVVAVLLLVYIYVILSALSRSPWGRVLKAIREDEEAAAALGKPVTWFKLQALMIGSAIAALAGVVYVSQNALITHLQFIPIVTFYAFIVVVIGGIGNHKGALIGAVILWGIFFGAQNAGLENFGIEAGPAQLIVVGAVLIIVMMFRPQGLVGSKEELLFAK